MQILKEEKPVNVGETEKKTFELYSKDKSVEEIAIERNLAVSTIYTHMYHLISNGLISVHEVISEEKINQVIEVYNKFKNEPKLKELLPETISYEEIRCVIANIKKSQDNDKNLVKV